MPHVVWLCIIVVTIAIELFTTAMVSIWFTFGAIAAEVLGLLRAPLWAQLMAFLLVSAAGFFGLRLLWEKRLKAKFTPTNADRNIGCVGLVTEDIDNLRETGEIKINGQLWGAKALNNEVIQQGSKVIIKKIEGVKVFVELFAPEE